MAVRPQYGAIESIRDICEPWVELWAGDEWGESMHGLLNASHTSYGLTDEDCAVVADILLRNVIAAREWASEYHDSPEDKEAEVRARREATEMRDYWLKGGNLGEWSTTIEDAKSSIEQMPGWFFDG
jgi:hypothetical protein